MHVEGTRVHPDIEARCIRVNGDRTHVSEEKEEREVKHCYFDDVKCPETDSCKECLEEHDRIAKGWIKRANTSNLSHKKEVLDEEN